MSEDARTERSEAQVWITREVELPHAVIDAHTAARLVFVGYSHDDPIMRYLALGLPSGTPRYAFTSADKANDPDWTRLGVVTIGYPVRADNHGALVAALEAWDVRARMGQTDHQARMKEIIDAGSTLR